MIYFIKTVSYKNKFVSQKRTYDFLCNLSLQRVDPKPLKKYYVDNSFDVVFCSDLRRVKESIVVRDNIPIIKNCILNEVIFDLKEMVCFDDWKKEGSNFVRKKFKEFFIKDMLFQSRRQIFSEIEDFLSHIQSVYKGKKVLVLSHSFKLKLIESFIKTKGQVRYDPNLINDFLDNNKKTFDFGRGFTMFN